MKCLPAMLASGLLVVSSPLWAQNPVGIILSGFARDCTIMHKGGVYDCLNHRELYMGDMVEKKPSAAQLKIRWAPYAGSEERDATTLEVVSNPRTISLTASVRRFVADFVKPPAGRDASAFIAPGAAFPPRATLLPGQPVFITASDIGRTVVLSDMEGRKLFEARTAGEDIVLAPETTRMRPGEEYTLVVGSGRHKRLSTVTLLDAGICGQVTKGLAEIEQGGDSPSERTILKAAYLQLMSDTHPGDVDLYWMADWMLRDGAVKFTEDQRRTVQRLHQRYQHHVVKKEVAVIKTGNEEKAWRHRKRGTRE